MRTRPIPVHSGAENESGAEDRDGGHDRTAERQGAASRYSAQAQLEQDRARRLRTIPADVTPGIATNQAIDDDADDLLSSRRDADRAAAAARLTSGPPAPRR